MNQQQVAEAEQGALVGMVEPSPAQTELTSSLAFVPAVESSIEGLDGVGTVVFDAFNDAFEKMMGSQSALESLGIKTE